MARNTPIFAMAARSIPVKRPSDMMVAILPILSGPMIVITALSAASTRAKMIMPMLELIYAPVRLSAPTGLLFFFFIFSRLLYASSAALSWEVAISR